MTYVSPPTMHASSAGSIAAATNSDAGVLADSKAVTFPVGLSTATAYTDIWHPGPLLPSPGSDHHLLAANTTRTAFVVANNGPGVNSASIPSTSWPTCSRPTQIS
jgi:hypothetical protein